MCRKCGWTRSCAAWCCRCERGGGRGELRSLVLQVNAGARGGTDAGGVEGEERQGEGREGD